MSEQVRPAVPFGLLPQGVEMRKTPPLPRELHDALELVRQKSGGRYGIFIFTEGNDACGDSELTLRPFRGPEWSDEWFMLAYKLFVGEFLQITPEMLATIKKGGPEVVGPQPPAPESATDLSAEVSRSDPSDPSRQSTAGYDISPSEPVL